MAFFQDVGSFFGRLGDSIRDAITVLHADVRDIGEGVGGLLTTLGNVPSKALDTIAGLGYNAERLGGSAISTAGTTIGKVADNAQILGSNVTGSVQQLGSNLGLNVERLGTEAVGSLWSPVLVIAAIGAAGLGAYFLYNHQDDIKQAIKKAKS